MHRSTASVRRAILLSVAALVLTGCGSSTGPDARGPVTARTVDGGIAVTNGTGEPIYTFVVGANISARINWAPVIDRPLAAGDTRVEPAYVKRDVPETHAVVNWWHGVPGGDHALRADSIRAVVVRLRD